MATESTQTTSEARRTANRSNAQKSTGPRTDAGKARSRLNGIVHGMRCETVVPEAERPAYELRMLQWGNALQPAPGPDTFTLQRTVAASLKLERIARAEAEAINDRQLDALDAWEEPRREILDAALARLDAEPSPEAVLAVGATSEGCRILAERWMALCHPARHDQIGPDWLPAALTLLGLAADATDPEIDDLRHCTVHEPRDAAHFASQRALAWITKSQELAEGPERAARLRLLDKAALDETTEGQLRHRYEVAAERSYYRGLNELKKAKRERERQGEPDLAAAAELMERFQRLMGDAPAPSEPNGGTKATPPAPSEPKTEVNPIVATAPAGPPPRPLTAGRAAEAA